MSKIAVYAIAKNEEQFIQRWYDSVKEADYVCVLDTGSTDNTVNMLKSCGAIVESKIISPWRFDVARNESLKIIPEDANILVCVDLDEIIQPGWAEIIRNEFKGTRGKYRYIWSHNEDGSPGVEFYSDKIHVKGYEWVNPVHKGFGRPLLCHRCGCIRQCDRLFRAGDGRGGDLRPDRIRQGDTRNGYHRRKPKCIEPAGDFRADQQDRCRAHRCGYALREGSLCQ